MRETVTDTRGAIKGLRSYVAAVSVTLVALLGVLGSSASAAHAEGVWWGLTSSSRPSYIKAGSGKPEVPGVPGEPEVQKVTIPMVTFEEPESADVKLEVAEMKVGAFCTPEPFNDEFCEGPGSLLTAANVEHALEGPYGAGKVHVSESRSTESIQLTVESNPGVRPLEAKEFVGITGPPTVEVVSPGKAGTPPIPAVPDGELVVTAENLGDQSVSGEKSNVVLRDVIPAGLEAIAVDGTKPSPEADFLFREALPCSITHENGLQVVSCVLSKEKEPLAPPPHDALAPYDQLQMRVSVNVKPGAVSGETNEVGVSGGESFVCNAVSAGTGSYRDSGCTNELEKGNFKRSSTGLSPTQTSKWPVTLSSAPVPFGVESYSLAHEEEGGEPTRQAGAHPFQQTTSIVLNQTADTSPAGGESHESHVNPVGLAKDVRFRWPAGLIGNPTQFAQCTDVQFFQVVEAGAANLCPPQSAVGVATVLVNEPSTAGVAEITVPLFNLTPRVGEPARLGFNVTMGNAPVTIDTAVRTGGDYGITVSVNNITQTAAFIASNVTVWGVPGAPGHEHQRGWACLLESRGFGSFAPLSPCGNVEGQTPPPFLSLPTSCEAPLFTSVEADPWSDPGAFTSFQGKSIPGESLVGCNRLPFVPQIKVTPDVQQASAPAGLNVDVHVPQEGQLNPTGLAQSAIRGITVKLPAGVAINPSSGDGLEACPENLVGFDPTAGANGFEEYPTEPGVANPVFSPFIPGAISALQFGYEGPTEPGKNFCANGSKIADVTIKTPLLPNPVKGYVYLASQEANPFNSVLAMYIVAEDPVSGSVIKLPGEVQICQAAGEAIAGMSCEAQGQLVSTFANNPQLAFEDAELHFFGGERAPLTSPNRCGTYTTEALYTPWSGTPPVKSTASFQITSGPNGSRCVNQGEALPFNPTLTGGATNLQAGAFSPFTLTMTRLPGEQNLQSVEAHLPPGLSGILSNIELCPEPQANQGACGPNSLIGETTVSVGVGGSPFTVSGGKFYLTGPYNGTGGCTVGTAGCAPFGITFEVPAKAGPFDFEHTKNTPEPNRACDCVIVRGKIEIDPHTAAITIVSNPPGTPDAIPTHLEGIPLEIQHVNAITTRGNFQFNPTNCNKMAVTGTIHSSEGGADTINVPLQVTNCGALKFAPKFSVSTKGANSKVKGATLTAKLSYPKAPQGTYANITRVKVDLPKQLPSRLTTLQKACTNKQFELNPANCPKESKIGFAKVTTPLLPVPLEGPAIFVSHGGEAFPSLTMVLQGYGVTIDLVGTTFISSKGITSTTFKTVPDTPFNSFTLTLPQGKFSALAANVPTKNHYSLCGQKLTMPTEFVAQNGAKINQSTKISVTGCKNAKKKAKTKKGKNKHAAKKGHK